jgi:hypothetical protein
MWSKTGTRKAGEEKVGQTLTFKQAGRRGGGEGGECREGEEEDGPHGWLEGGVAAERRAKVARVRGRRGEEVQARLVERRDEGGGEDPREGCGERREGKEREETPTARARGRSFHRNPNDEKMTLNKAIPEGWDGPFSLLFCLVVVFS